MGNNFCAKDVEETMKEFSGRIIKGRSDWYYETLLAGEPYCHDSSKHCNIRINESPAWGYEGAGPYRMAAVLLASALVGMRGTFNVTDLTHGPLLFPSPRDMPTFNESQEVQRRVRLHYADYAREVVFNLPDTWELSRQEILDWLKRKEEGEKPESNMPVDKTVDVRRV